MPPSDKTQLARRFDLVRKALNRRRIQLAGFMLLPNLSAEEGADLRHQVLEESALSQGYVLMCGLSAGIATLGLLQSSTAVVIGAMLVSPLMAPIAALGFGFASLDGQRIRDAARVVLVGAAIGILVGVLLTWLSPIRNATPEILARTQPTLLDLAVALLSGLAGGYATVWGKGGTAIGVAIATALMPPLATVGYGIGVLEPTYALGALLLFLTNLSAIAFAFAAVARISGVARPIEKVVLSPRYVSIGLVAFLALATPLALTLLQVTREARLRADAGTTIVQAMKTKGARTAQLDVSWSLFSDPKVSAVVVSNGYDPLAETAVRDALTKHIGTTPELSLQQVVAADLSGQTRAMIDSAIERTNAGIAANSPPLGEVRARVGVPTRGIWVDQAGRVINVEPFAVPEWKLADYRTLEDKVISSVEGWKVRIVPPIQWRLNVRVDADADADDALTPQLATWAIERWGLTSVLINVREGDDTTALQQSLTAADVKSSPGGTREPPRGIAVVELDPAVQPAIPAPDPNALPAAAPAPAPAPAPARASTPAPAPAPAR